MVCGGDNKNGESKLAGKAAFNSDFNFNLYEYFHFCSKMMKKDDTKPVSRGRSSDSPCMIVFCSWEQQSTLLDAAKKHGFNKYIPLVFIKNYSPQVLKANMRVVGATEYALLLYRDRLPKFRNGLKVDENGKNITGTGHMVFNWFEWERDGKEIPKIHPAQILRQTGRSEQMRENIEWLIEHYTYKIEDLERDAREQSLGMTYITGAIRAYSEVVEDLRSILDESEDEECRR